MVQWILVIAFVAICFAYYMSQKQKIRREQLRERREERQQELMEMLRKRKEEDQSAADHND